MKIGVANKASKCNVPVQYKLYQYIRWLHIPTHRVWNVLARVSICGTLVMQQVSLKK